MNEELTVSPSTKAKQQKIDRVKELEKNISKGLENFSIEKSKEN